MTDPQSRMCAFDAQTAVTSCQRCQKPVCVDHAHPAAVGYQCPNCVQQGRVSRPHPTRVTRTVTLVLAVVFAATQLADPNVAASTFGLRPFSVAPRGPELLTLVFGTQAPWAWPTPIGQPWLLLTSALLHANLLHILFNGVLLWQLGAILEPRVGPHRFAALLTTGALGGAFGVMLLSWAGVTFNLTQTVVGDLIGMNPLSVTVGASGAVFALMGATVTLIQQHGYNPWRSGIGGLVIINVIITFVVPQISVGGHIGGLLTGMALGRFALSREVAVSRLWLLAAALTASSVWLASQIVAAFLT